MFAELQQTRPFRMYSPEEPNHPTRIFGGEASGIRSWDDVKYPIFLEYQKKMFGEFWIPEEVSMSKDIEQYETRLTEAEKKVYQYNSGMLNWLDSMASDVVTMLFLSTTDPSLRSLLTLVASFETMHNISYEHITASVLTSTEKKNAFEEVRENPQLQKRNQHIIEKLDRMSVAISDYLVDNTKSDSTEMSEETLQIIFEGIVAYQILEGLYFSGGFVYFHSLARDNKMLESNDVIAMIRADENFHSELFGTLIQIMMQENSFLNTEENLEYVMNYIKEAVELEKEWASWLYQGIDTLTIPEYHNYVEYLANLICRNAGMSEPYPNNGELKSKWIITYGSKKSGDSEVAVKADFLQGNAINYKHEDGGDFDL